MKILWHDGVGMSLYTKRLEHGRFVWPAARDGAVAISAAQMAYLLDGIDWRKPPPHLEAGVVPKARLRRDGRLIAAGRGPGREGHLQRSATAC